jgi:alanyl-tRNA synthetase
VTSEELHAIENEVNDIIMNNYEVRAQEKPLAVAREEGAMALFGEKYGDTVRTISIVGREGNRYSYELCGGTHLSETAEIGPFLIVSEGSVSAGIRRIEALTGCGALYNIQHNRSTLGELAAQLGTAPDFVGERVMNLQEELTQAKKQLDRLQRELARRQFDQLITSLEQVNGTQALIAQLDGVAPETLREMSDWFRNTVKSGVLVLGSITEGRPQLLVAVTDDLTKKGLHAGNLIKQIAPVIGGGGGGRPTMAQAGGKDVTKLPAALDTARQLIAGSHSSG